MSNIAEFSIPPVVKTVDLPVSVEQAFEHYVQGLPHWFPIAQFFAGTSPPAECYVEPHLNGRLYERSPENQDVIWGRITVWEPPHRLAYTWQVGTTEDKAQLIELHFVATPAGSQVTVQHTGWEKLGERAANARTAYDGGWEFVLGKCYREYVLAKAKDGEGVLAKV